MGLVLICAMALGTVSAANVPQTQAWVDLNVASEASRGASSEDDADNNKNKSSKIAAGIIGGVCGIAFIGVSIVVYIVCRSRRDALSTAAARRRMRLREELREHNGQAVLLGSDRRSGVVVMLDDVHVRGVPLETYDQLLLRINAVYREAETAAAAEWSGGESNGAADERAAPLSVLHHVHSPEHILHRDPMETDTPLDIATQSLPLGRRIGSNNIRNEVIQVPGSNPSFNSSSFSASFRTRSGVPPPSANDSPLSRSTRPAASAPTHFVAVPPSGAIRGSHSSSPSLRPQWGLGPLGLNMLASRRRDDNGNVIPLALPPPAGEDVYQLFRSYEPTPATTAAGPAVRNMSALTLPSANSTVRSAILSGASFAEEEVGGEEAADHDERGDDDDDDDDATLQQLVSPSTVRRRASSRSSSSAYSSLRFDILPDAVDRYGSATYIRINGGGDMELRDGVVVWIHSDPAAAGGEMKEAVGSPKSLTSSMSSSSGSDSHHEVEEENAFGVFTEPVVFSPRGAAASHEPIQPR